MDQLPRSRTLGAAFGVCLAVVCLCLAGTGIVGAQSADIVVATDGSGDYTSIQNAVDNASDGDRIRVKSGTYEQHTEISKNITLYAPNGATIANTSVVASKYSTFDARSGFQIFGDVTPTISGFTLTDWRWAISAGGSKGGWTVKNTEISGGTCGVCAAGTPGNWTVVDSTIDVNYDEAAISGYDSSGAWQVKNTTIRNGQILADLSSGDPLIQNVSFSAFEEGVDFDDSTGSPTIRDITLQNSTGEAIELDNASGHVTISNATILDVDQGSEDAITADKSSGTIDIDNIHIQTARNGIDVENSGQWTIENVTIENVDSGIDAENTNATHTPVIRDTIVVGTSEEGIDITGSKSDVLITGSTVRNTGDHAIIIEDSMGDWTIEDTTLENISGAGIDAFNQPDSSHATIRNLTVTDTQNHGVNFYNSSGDWDIIDSHISNSDRKGVEAGDTTGDWSITSTTVETTKNTLIEASGAVGNWEVHESKLLTSGVALNATGAAKGNASYNYWRATDGPSGQFNGSGGQARGNVTVTPFYTDRSLTTLNTDSAGDGTDSDDPVAAYTTEEGIVDAPGLLDAAADFRNGEIEADVLLDVASAFRSNEPV